MSTRKLGVLVSVVLVLGAAYSYCGGERLHLDDLSGLDPPDRRDRLRTQRAVISSSQQRKEK